MPRLIAPDVRVRESFVAAMAEFAAEGRGGDRTIIGRDLAEHSDQWRTADGFAAFVAAMRTEERQPRRSGLVPQTTWWWVEGPERAPEFLGRIAVRHRLTDALRRVGGHIGYDVRRSRRREGHATAMLAAALPLAHAMGIDPALITCDATNMASRRVIERNGGRRTPAPSATPTPGFLHFWVPTTLRS